MAGGAHAARQLLGTLLSPRQNRIGTTPLRLSAPRPPTPARAALKLVLSLGASLTLHLNNLPSGEAHPAPKLYPPLWMMGAGEERLCR